jgi:hypothetical protein
MPRCVLNEQCAWPDLALREGHKCPVCLGCVHVFCGVEDPLATDLHLNITCNACVARMQLQVETQGTADKRKPPPKENPAPSEKKKAPIGKKKKQHHRQALELVPPKLKKSVTASSFRLKAATGSQDPLIMKNVCFLADDKGSGEKLVEHFGGVGRIEESLQSIEGKLYLFGNVVRASKLPKKGNSKVVAYDIQWEDLVLGETQIDLQVVVPAIELSVAVLRRRVLFVLGGLMATRCSS